jgi:hypothetical protein
VFSLLQLTLVEAVVDLDISCKVSGLSPLTQGQHDARQATQDGQRSLGSSWRRRGTTKLIRKMQVPSSCDSLHAGPTLLAPTNDPYQVRGTYKRSTEKAGCEE